MEEFVYKIIIETLKSPLFLIVIIFGILSSLFYKRIRGFMGEFWVKYELKKLSSNDYIVLNDIMIASNGSTHQIDHIVISKYGIFVIEMKNYYGMILGEQYKEKWIQYLGKNKSYFNNPIRQNYGHIKSLSLILNIEEEKFISIICFSNQARLKIKIDNVVQLDNLVDKIKKYDKEKIDIDIRIIKEKIIKANIVDRFKRRNHIIKIKNDIKRDEAKEQNMVCPKCNNKLVVRNSKYGQFIGCSNYPKCKYTNHIKL